MAGGGSSGKVSYPDYVETDHEAWLDDIETIIHAELSADSPYTGELAYNPDLDISASERRMEKFEEVITDIDEETTWVDFIDRALTKADEVLFDETVLKNARTAFNHRSEDEFVSGVNSLSAWAGGVGSVDSSAFSIGLALLEMERERKVDDFDSTLQFELYKLRGQYMIQGTQQMAQILSMRVSGEQSATATRDQIMKSAVVAKKEQVDRDMEIDVQDGLWDLKLFNYAAQLLAGPGGGVALPKEPSPLVSGLAGAAGGFAAGGPAGAVIGGLAGFLS